MLLFLYPLHSSKRYDIELSYIFPLSHTEELTSPIVVVQCSSYTDVREGYL